MKKIRLTESEFHSLIRKIVKETQREMGEMDYEDMEIEDMDVEEGEELSKGDVVDLIAQFFRNEVLPELSPEEKFEIKKELGQEGISQLSEMFLNENLSDRIAKFKEKAMMRGGLGLAAMGALGLAGESMGWSEHELTTKIHEFVESFGFGNYSGPITVAMIAAGLALAFRGRSKKYERTGK